mmetsp:Transcript_2130/g.1463  ORF Transcript_2130/g.1463 Transcript_2130/m.1463 type:complete len:110 (+) Transcript_2130:234-563(+)
MRPNRAIVTKDLLSHFIHDYMDQNPISKLALIASYREQATALSQFIDSATDHQQALKSFCDFEGNISLQNSLQVAVDLFGSIPRYAQKEILIVNSSLTNCDPGDLSKLQ